MSKLKAVPASSVDKRMKLFLWGASKAGKTVLALQFPAPYVIDMERGTDHYGDLYKFDVLKTEDVDLVIEQITALKTEKHEYKTLVIDSISVLWDAFQTKWTDIIAGVKDPKAENPYYELSFGDWRIINPEWAALMRSLVDLDMNVIATAHSKVKYKKGSMAVTDGDTFDSQKDTNYYFDTEIQMYVRDGVHYGVCTGDKSGKLPTFVEFEPAFDYFAGHYGSDQLNRPAKVVTLSTDDQRKRLLQLQEEKKITDSTLRKGLEGYQVKNTKSLTVTQADELIGRLEKYATS